MTWEQYLDRTERMNLVEVPVGKNGKGDAFPMAKAAKLAKKLIDSRRLNHRFVILLGHNVAKAILGTRFQVLLWIPVVAGFNCVFMAAVVPHPSGINRWWNDRKNRRKAEKFLHGCFF